ncbi:DNA topoisomerase IB [Pseudomonas aeruginosa]|nr:DNA topoisomerase IB [Pseudomonas aeruginosa]
MSAAPPDIPALPAGLCYVDDRQPGIRRRRQGKRFVYFDADGQRIGDAEEIRRLAKLAIPPAYREVWICPDPNGHLQATGRDARGRKQYRYHPRWREVRDADKYERLLRFGQALPRLRRHIAAQLRLPGLGRDKVVALAVALLDATLIRVGNHRYARDNRSYGLTTLRTRHVDVNGSRIRFRFKGKSGIEHDVSLEHPRLARVLRRCLELPGQDLLQYLDEDGQPHRIGSHDINEYLRRHTGEDFSAKDYRTWAGSALALERLRRAEADGLGAVVAEVAAELGNSVAICRQCYIHPAIIEAYQAGQLGQLRRARKRRWRSAEEATLLAFLDTPG